MPIYKYRCLVHGTFEIIQNMGEVTAFCPICGRTMTREVTSPSRITVNEKEKLPYGSGSRGRFVSHTETGGMDILVPSWGSMEKEEVEYVTQAAVEKEKERVKKNPRQNTTKERIGALTRLAYSTKSGQRAKVIKEAMREYQ